MNSLPRREAFTLVEVMVALVIIGVAMVTLLATHVSSTHTWAEAKATTIATLLARQKLAEILAGEFPEPGEQSGSFEQNEHYRWKLSVRETDLDTLREITLEVSLAPQEALEDESGLGSVTVVTYLADPGNPEEEEEEEAEETAGGEANAG